MSARTNSPSLAPLTPAGAPAATPADAALPPALAAAGPAIDRTVLLASAEHDLAFLAQVIEIFLAESPGLLGQIRLGIRQQNAESVERATLTLKRALANFGAHRAAETSRQIERCARELLFDEAAGLLPSLESSLSDTCRALSDFLREAPSPR